MKAPERITSTPRFIAVILTLVLSWLSLTGKIEPESFLAIVTLVFGYFFGQRKAENSDLSGSNTGTK